MFTFIKIGVNSVDFFLYLFPIKHFKRNYKTRSKENLTNNLLLNSFNSLPETYSRLFFTLLFTNQ